MKLKFKFKILHNNKFGKQTERRIKIVPFDEKNGTFTSDDIRELYQYMTEELGTDHKNIMIFGQALDKTRSIKRRNEQAINLLDVDEYYNNKSNYKGKFVDNFLSLDIYIYS